ncbi:hypothetical protein RF11_12096 [Thelohanellus kitauei]|uniref:Uncharacterized protein n=1 Tax=Thelohanellus kitauei TaxID=669202 RepID=A0A0C2M8Q5_THEKT|nr:hypothetical protein RF11_12096 [Thelohanellus kitauei]
MNSSQKFDKKVNESLLKQYCRVENCTEFSIQKEAIRKVISHFTPQSNYDDDYKFIGRFPKHLYKQFKLMSEGNTTVDDYKEKKELFMEKSQYAVTCPKQVSSEIFSKIYHNLGKTSKIESCFNDGFNHDMH